MMRADSALRQAGRRARWGNREASRRPLVPESLRLWRNRVSLNLRANYVAFYLDLAMSVQLWSFLAPLGCPPLDGWYVK